MGIELGVKILGLPCGAPNFKYCTRPAGNLYVH